MKEQALRDCPLGGAQGFGSVMGSEASEGPRVASPDLPVVRSPLDSSPHLPLHRRYVSALDDAHHPAASHDSPTSPGSPVSPMVARYLLEEYHAAPPADGEQTIRQLFLGEHPEGGSNLAVRGDCESDGSRADRESRRSWRHDRGLTVNTAQLEATVAAKLGVVQSLSPLDGGNSSHKTLHHQQKSTSAAFGRRSSESGSRKSSSGSSRSHRQLHGDQGGSSPPPGRDPSLAPLKPRAREASRFPSGNRSDDNDEDGSSSSSDDCGSQPYSYASDPLLVATGGRVFPRREKSPSGSASGMGRGGSHPRPSSAALAPSVSSQDNATASNWGAPFLASSCGDGSCGESVPEIMSDGGSQEGRQSYPKPKPWSAVSASSPELLPPGQEAELRRLHEDPGPHVDDTHSEGISACACCNPACEAEDEGGFCDCPDGREWSLVSTDQKEGQQQQQFVDGSFSSPSPPSVRAGPWLLTAMYDGSPAGSLTPDSMTGEIISIVGGSRCQRESNQHGSEQASSPSQFPRGAEAHSSQAVAMQRQSHENQSSPLLRDPGDIPSGDSGLPFFPNSKCGWKPPELLQQNLSDCMALDDEDDDGTPTFIAAPPRRRSGSGTGILVLSSTPHNPANGATGNVDSPSRFQKPQPLKIVDAFSSSPSVSAHPSPSYSGSITPSDSIMSGSRQPSWITPSPRADPKFSLVQHLGMVTGGLFDDEDY